MTSVVIVACGPATTIQDLGRPGFARIGLPPTGAMDPRALQTANMLVGNAPGEAAIELAYMGLIARIEGGTAHLALAGAPAVIRVDGCERESHRAFEICDGETLEIGAMREGAYAMLAFAGGVSVPPALSSRSLDARAGIGGFQGRALRAGDRIPLGTPQHPFVERVMRPIPLVPDAPIRVVLGPQMDAFTERGLQTLIGRPFRIAHASNRMAVRLDGHAIERRPGYEMMSEGTLPGSIQVPPDGSPLVLMADRQTVGGYPKIATVIGTDLGRLAQRRIGATVNFVPISAIEAREIARQQHLAEQDLSNQGTNLAGRAMARMPEIDSARLVGIADAVVDAVCDDSWESGAIGTVRRL